MKSIKRAAAIFSFFAAIGVVAAPAQAQQYDITRAGLQIYRSCTSLGAGQIAGDLKTSCACLVGYYGGIMSDRDLALADILLRAGVLAQRGATQEQIVAEIGADLENGGYTDVDINRVAAAVEQSAARIDLVCAGFQQPGASV